MYRPRRHRLEAELQTDSLMDILACTVGILLLVVAFSVLEFRGTPVRVTMPLAQEPPTNAVRVIVICSEGRLKLFEHESKVEALMEGVERTNLSGLGGWVAKANAKEIKDDYFTYGLNYTAPEYFWGYMIRWPTCELVIKERPGYPGETLEAILAQDSIYQQRLRGWNRENAWLSFAVADDSLELFREARSIAREMGYATGWDPFTLTFPIRRNLLADYRSDPLAPSVLSTQQ